MKYIILFIAFSTILLMSGCNDEEIQSKKNCDELVEWSGYDEECGCYGDKIGFSKKCITTIEGDTPFIGYINYGHIKDSILLIYHSNSIDVDIVTISDIPSIDRKGTELNWYLENNKQIQLMYDDSNWDNPDALGKATEIRIDPKEVIEEPEQITLRVYQREFYSLGSEILDSITIVVVKDINRK